MGVKGKKEWTSVSDSTFDPEFHQTCDDCHEPGDSDSMGWYMDEKTQKVYCQDCWDKRNKRR